MPLTPVRKGQPVKLSAKTWNTLQKSAEVTLNTYATGARKKGKKGKGADIVHPFFCTFVADDQVVMEPGFVNGHMPTVAGVPLTADPAPIITLPDEPAIFIYCKILVDPYGKPLTTARPIELASGQPETVFFDGNDIYAQITLAIVSQEREYIRVRQSSIDSYIATNQLIVTRAG